MAYVEVPVSAAQGISKLYGKDIVIITAWTEEDNIVHTTTYGRIARYKPGAAKLGERLATAAGCDLSQKTRFSDFRDMTAAEYAEELEKKDAKIRELELQIGRADFGSGGRV